MKAKTHLSIRIPIELNTELEKLGNNKTEISERLLWQGLAWRAEHGDTLPGEDEEKDPFRGIRGAMAKLEARSDRQEATITELKASLAQLAEKLDTLEKLEPVAA